MSLSDHLDMLGVELRATWIQTRKANCDILQDRVEKTVRQWKSGKFMPLTMRPWSMNSYCLPKIWFRAHCVDLRQLDINKIHSNIKSWIYGDQFIKPEEKVLFRPPSFGGLGVHHAKLKAQAALTRSFLETACHPNFIHSLYHSNLYKFHVLNDDSIPDPGFPSFYPREFFAKIREVHRESPLNVATMTQKHWYTLLLEDCCIKEYRGDGTQKYIRTKVELASPETDWESSWRLARLKGLGPDHTTFLFKLLHNILPTQERLHRANNDVSQHCKAQGCSEVDDLCHSLVQCQANQQVGNNLVKLLRLHQPSLTTAALLRLELDVDDDHELPLVWLSAATLLSIWEQKKTSNRVQPHLTRSQLEAKVNILRETRMNSMVNLLKDEINTMFEQ